ncbi:MAG: LacI family DNA-binding transcriptional regulator [Candidatus Methylacidiphilales bacterium]|nr:LacI family DNA-binding transcriptional regulator [Candidatus Methylacidiphilales bacterium]
MAPDAPSLASLAKAAGVAPSTVSRALANSARIPVSTRIRIQQLAKEMNYRPNPFGSAMAARLRLSRSSRSHATLACIHTGDPSDKDWYANPFYRRYLQGVESQAKTLGYDLQSFYLRGKDMNALRLSSILHARGINGVVIPTIPNPEENLELEWDHFASATIGFQFKHPMLHSAMNRHDHTISLVLREMTRLGYQRIGLMILRLSELLAERAFTAAYLLHQSEQSRNHRIPILVTGLGDEGHQYSQFKAWVESAHPDAVISLGMGPHILRWLAEMNLNVPGDIGVADMDVHPPTTLAGVDQLHEMVGAAAVDLVLGQIHRNESGVPEHPKTVMLEGVWRGGETVRSLS